MSRRRSFPALCLCLAALAACESSPTPPTELEPSGPVGPDSVWLRSAVGAISSLEPGAGPQDLDVLRSIVGDARVVALGQPVWGSREALLFTRRAAELLVGEMGFNVIALEASWPESTIVDAWIAGAPGSPDRSLSRLFEWYWNTDEILDLIEWMRGVSSGADIRFAGYDMQHPALAMDMVVDYLAGVDPQEAPAAESRFACFRPFQNDLRGQRAVLYSGVSSVGQIQCRNTMSGVEAQLLGSQDVYRSVSGDAEYERARQAMRVILQNEAMFAGDGPAARGVHMATNVKWLLEQAGPDGRVLLLGHNSQIQDGLIGDALTMGASLRNDLGSDIVTIGGAFYRGFFQAIEVDSGGNVGTLGVRKVGPAPEDTYEWFLRTARVSHFLLDLDRVAESPDPTREWFARPHGLRFVGEILQDGTNYFQSRSLTGIFDAVLFSMESRPTTVRAFEF